MTVTKEDIDYAYAAGEDVVVRMTGIAVHNVEEGRPMAATCVPAWVIATIVALAGGTAGARYVLRFPVHDAVCLAIAGEAAIEGVA